MSKFFPQEEKERGAEAVRRIIEDIVVAFEQSLDMQKNSAHISIQQACNDKAFTVGLRSAISKYLEIESLLK